MAEGIKLYKHFVDQISKMGKIKRAWFTTFNLDISFFEKYILSALMGESYRDIKSPYDYEALSANLANDQDSFDGEKMEVKVFYDYRALNITGKPKQTSVQLHSINVKLIKNIHPELQFSNGVFHPKVIILETYQGEYWLMVASANITFSGWSRNRECFFCEKIENTYIARDIGLFFSGISNDIKGFNENMLLKKLKSRRFGKEKPKWDFMSSFNSKKFIDSLNDTEYKTKLQVWSPYFADDLSNLIDEISDTHFDDITVIPAKNENQKIRITEEVFNECLNRKNVSFKQDKVTSLLQESFVHAKVWLTPKVIAIGSWNMTRSGMNISITGNNNIEAGIIYKLSNKEYDSIINENPIGSLKSALHFSEVDLEKEKEDILDKFSITIDLIADWDKLEIRLVNPSYNKLMNLLDADDFVVLPGLGSVKLNSFETPINFRASTRILLTDRFFEVKSKYDITLYKGYLREEGLKSRPVNSFENIDDYLKGWVLEKPEDKEELHRLAYSIEEEIGDELNIQTRNILMSNDQNAWFTSFHAFECICNRIKGIKENKNYYAKERITELKKIGRVLPGSLTELKKHLETLLNTYTNDKQNFAKSPIYLWFLIEKANYIFSVFNTEVGLKNIDEHIKPTKNLKWNMLLKNEDIKAIGHDNLEKWRKYIVYKLKN